MSLEVYNGLFLLLVLSNFSTEQKSMFLHVILSVRKITYNIQLNLLSFTDKPRQSPQKSTHKPNLVTVF